MKGLSPKSLQPSDWSQTIQSAKLSQNEKKAGIYPYYAGYTLSFVKSVLRHFGVKAGQSLLDPWNGTGTSTYAASCAGMHATGVDLNPVLAIVAKARCADHSANILVDEWINSYDGRADDCVRDVAVGIYRRATADYRFISGSSAEALLLTAIFGAVRKNATVARTQNPAWYSSKRLLASKSVISQPAQFVTLSAKDTLARHRALPAASDNLVTIINDDFRTVMFPVGGFDVVITSPPYLTRLDYVKATLPELLFLDMIDLALPTDYLRRRMLGSPLTDIILPTELSTLPEDIRSVLFRISNHPSKASATYYHSFFARYFVNLRQAIMQLSASVRKGGRVCIVVQPSYYKTIFVDLPSLVGSLMRESGLDLDLSCEFDTARSMAVVNVKAAREARRPVAETAIFATKVDRVWI